ncbi:MAG: hypothetical protein KF724_07950 [Phycisphaeraceae bacterium]|nr:hypothetical protein [Phycisphaeraceae bacterium]
MRRLLARRRRAMAQISAPLLLCGVVCVLLSPMSIAAAREPQGAGRRFPPTVEQRLAALEPARPMEYFTLAEEVEARARTPEERDLARELYGLAGALDPEGLGASAALALASLADRPAERSKFIRLSMALRGGSEARQGVRASSPQAALFGELLAAYRRGQGARARELLANPEVSEMVELHGDHFEGGAAGLRNAIAGLRDRPVETDVRMMELMFLESAMLESRRSLVQDLLRGGGEPLVACDPLRPGPELGVDVERARWRGGQWVE